VNVGATGRAGDAGVFADCSLKKDLANKTLNIPPLETIEGVSVKICYHIVADDAFPLTKNIVKPYPHRKLDKSKQIFNYRLSRARRVVEMHLASWQIDLECFSQLSTTINLGHEKVNDIILATCCLHNFMVANNMSNYTSCQDIEDTDNQQFTPGQWRRDTQLYGIQTTSVRDSSKSAKEQRVELPNYFVSENGSVPWQDYMCSL
jgi:hypothetical protein